MRGKRFISTLLLTVYLLAVSGAAWASLSCDCVTMHARTAHVHSCRCHCSCHHHVRAAHDAPADGVSLTAPCCDDRHSTQIELYTAAQDDEPTCRCTVIDLPHCLAAAQSARLAAPKFRKQALAPPAVRALPDPSLPLSGLRAPPVSA